MLVAALSSLEPVSLEFLEIVHDVPRNQPVAPSVRLARPLTSRQSARRITPHRQHAEPRAERSRRRGHCRGGILMIQEKEFADRAVETPTVQV
jgi:hypothetical protein